MRSSMWSTMPTPWRQPISAARSISSTGSRTLAVERDGHAVLEADDEPLRLVGRVARVRHELEDLF